MRSHVRICFLETNCRDINSFFLFLLHQNKRQIWKKKLQKVRKKIVNEVIFRSKNCKENYSVHVWQISAILQLRKIKVTFLCNNINIAMRPKTASAVKILIEGYNPNFLRSKASSGIINMFRLRLAYKCKLKMCVSYSYLQLIFLIHITHFPRFYPFRTFVLYIYIKALCGMFFSIIFLYVKNKTTNLKCVIRVSFIEIHLISFSNLTLTNTKNPNTAIT